MSRIYVGNLPMDVDRKEIDDLFYKYGRIREIDLKTPHRPPAYAFITYDDYRDADDAIRGRDGYNFDGNRLRVEHAKSESGDSRGGRGGGGRRDDRGGGRGGGGRGGGRRTEYGVVITGLPKCSWQDLKDYMRNKGRLDVVYGDIERYGSEYEGIVEYSNRKDMIDAVRTLDDTEFYSENTRDSAIIRVRFANSRDADEYRDRKASPEPRKGRSHSRSSSRGRKSESRSRSRSRDRKAASRSRSRSVSEDRGRRASSDAVEKTRSPSEDK